MTNSIATRSRRWAAGCAAVLLPALIVLTSGCRPAAPPADEPAGGNIAPVSDGDSGTTRVTPSSGTNHLTPAPPREATPELVTRTAPSGTEIAARLETTMDSSTSSVGDTVQATLVSDVRDSGDQVVLPSGTKLTGRVTEVVSARKVKKKSSLAFRFDRAVLPDGSTTDISAGEGIDGKGWTGKQGAIIGGSAAGGALLGQLLGHDTKSTVGGAIVGGGVATGVIMSHKGEDIVLSAGSTMHLHLDSDVQVRRPSNS